MSESKSRTQHIERLREKLDQYGHASPTLVSVAEYILDSVGPMSSMKLQKLLYYSQAWHLAWDSEPLFEDEIHAWANGPVVVALYPLHMGRFQVYPGQIQLMSRALRSRPALFWDAKRQSWAWSIPDFYEEVVSSMRCVRIGWCDTWQQAHDAALGQLATNAALALSKIAEQWRADNPDGPKPIANVRAC